MAFDGLVNYTIVKELQKQIINGKVDKIFEPNNNEIILGIYSNGIKYALNIVVSSNNYRICLTTSSKPNPTNAPNFCMVLRKYLLNLKITNIYTLSLERIVVIEFEGYDKSHDFGTKKLIIELMGKHSNVILVDSNNIIIDSLRHFSITSNSYRNILPNCQYMLPISEKLDFLEVKDANDLYPTIINYINDRLNIDNSTQISNFKLSNVIPNTFTGICKTSILYIIENLSLQDILTQENAKKIYEYLSKIISNSNCAMAIPFNNDYAIFSMSINNKLDPLQVNFFIDDYYSKKEVSENFLTYRNNFSKLLLNYTKKLNIKLSNINAKLKECQNTELYRLYGELITNNLYRIENTHSDKITIENYYDNNNLITIPLDKTMSPSMNAKKYFKKYNKLKNARSIVESQKEEAEKEIDYLESIIYEFQEADTISDIDIIYSEFSENFLKKDILQTSKKASKKKSKNPKNNILKIGEPLKYQIDGFTVLVGKNNKQNDYITKHAKPNDIWFHTKDVHGSHLILKIDNAKPSQDTINKCASLAAFHSKASESSNVSVDYTYIKYVKKPSNAKPRNGNLYKL